jgi:hypothetical protein
MIYTWVWVLNGPGINVKTGELLQRVCNVQWDKQVLKLIQWCTKSGKARITSCASSKWHLHVARLCAICSGTEGRRLLHWVLNTSDRLINFISESSTLLLSRVYRACAMDYGLSSDNVSTKLCNRTLHSVEPNLYALYILDIFLWVWNLVSRVKEIKVG